MNYNESYVDFSKLNVGDKFNLLYNGKQEKFVVLGKNINPNKGCTYSFIDIMSTRCLIQSTYADENKVAFLDYSKSKLKTKLNSTIVNFTEDIQSKVVNKETKVLTGRKDQKRCYTIIDLGKVWIPSVQEIFGEVYYSDACHRNKQYSYFEDENNRKLGNPWWTCSAWSFTDRLVCCVNSNGEGNYWYNYNTLNAPLCLRIKI